MKEKGKPRTKKKALARTKPKKKTIRKVVVQKAPAKAKPAKKPTRKAPPRKRKPRARAFKPLVPPMRTDTKATMEKYAQAIGMEYPAAIHKPDLWALLQRSKSALAKISIEPSQVEKQEAFEVFEVLDSQQVNSQLTGRMVGEYLEAYGYKFPTSTGKIITGLSKEGINQACILYALQGWAFRQMGPPIITEDPEPDGYCKVVVEVGRYRLQQDRETREITGSVLIDTMFGSKRRWKKMRTKSGKIYDDSFFFEKAMVMAGRNARRDLLPYPFKVMVLKEFEKIGKVVKVRRKAVIGNDERKRLNAVAKEKGIDHPALLKWLGGKYGMSSTNQLTPALFQEVIKELNAINPIPEMPESIKTGCGFVGLSEADATGTWMKAVAKYGDKAETKMEDYLQKLADKGAK